MERLLELSLSALASTAGSLVKGIVGSSTVVSVPLSDDLMFKVSVVPSVAAMAANARDVIAEEVFVRVKDKPPVTIAEGRADMLNFVRPMLRRCSCHIGDDEHGPVWEPTFIGLSGKARGWMTSENAVRELNMRSLRVWGPMSDQNLYKYDDLYMVLPFLCVRFYDTALAMPQRITPTLILPARGIAYFSDTTGVGCQLPSGETHDVRADYRSATDMLGTFCRLDRSHKIELRVGGLGCVMCHPTRPHGISDSFFDNAKTIDRRWSAPRGVLHACLALNNAWKAAGCPMQIQVTAWSSNYGSVNAMVFYSWPAFVFVVTPEDSAAVAARGSTPILIEMIAGGTHYLANIRVFASAALPAGVTVHCTNAWPGIDWLCDISIPPVAPIESHGNSILNTIVCSCLLSPGAFNLAKVAPLSVVGRFMGLYGLEEASLARIDGAIARVDHGWDPWALEMAVYPGVDRQFPLTVRSLHRNKYASARGGQRAHLVPFIRIIAAWRRRADTVTTWTAAWNLELGAWVDPGPIAIESTPANPLVRPGRPLTIGGAIGSNIGVVNWFVFGSHGDVIPILALARRMAGFGIDVHVIRTHTEQEGGQILKYAEEGQLVKAAPYFLQTMAVAGSAPGVVFGPPEFTTVSVGVNLRPPASIIHPVDFGAGHAVNFAIDALLRGWAPMINVGAYHGVTWLPRSADGLNFLKQSKNTKRPIDIMLAWGSSSLPRPVIADAVEVKPGDHFSQFEQAKVVVCHGGAGTVQTAAAAGARVISGTSLMDRKYRDTLDAGRGVMPGSDPDAVMLMFLPITPLTWVWAYKHSWKMFYRALCLGAYWVVLPALWVVLALSLRSIFILWHIPDIEVVFSVSFIATVYASLFVSYVGPLWATVLGPQAETLTFYLLNHMGITIPAGLLYLLQGLSSIARSPVLWSLLVTGHPQVAVPISVIFNFVQVLPMLTTEFLGLVVGTPATSHQEVALVGVSWAWQDSNIPAFHTRFISESHTEMIEGEWVTGRRDIGALYSLRRKPFVDDIPFEWRLRTRIPWNKFDTFVPITAPYSPFWNCQSGMLYAIRGSWIMLSMAFFVLIPMGLWLLFAMLGSMFVLGISSLLLDVLPVLALALECAGEGERIPGIRAWLAQRYCYLLESEGNWYAMGLALTTGLGTGWSGSSSSVPSILRIFRATTFQECVSIMISEAWTLSRAEKKMLKVKMDMLIGCVDEETPPQRHAVFSSFDHIEEFWPSVDAGLGGAKPAEEMPGVDFCVVSFLFWLFVPQQVWQ